MDFLSKQDKAKLLVLIDFQKGFDCLEWSYINQVLEKYHFGSDFIRWFNILYTNASSCVINNGFFSEFFRIHRSCRQGDLLSPYLFILCIEPLAIAIKNSSHIKGVTFGNIELTIGQYADDTFLLLDGSEHSLRESVALPKEFYKCSGFKINVDKTQVAWLGSNRHKYAICSNLKLS